MRYKSLEGNKNYWKCPICSEHFKKGKAQKKHIFLERTELVESLKILNAL